MLIKDLMTSSVFCVHQDRPVSLAKDIMNWRHIRHIPVIDDQERLVGLLTHRDLLSFAISSLANIKPELQNDLDHHMKLEEVMNKNVKCLDEELDIRVAASVLLEEKIGCIVVTDAQQRVKGILTESDFLKWIESKL